MSVLSLTPEPTTAPLPAEEPASAAAADAAALTRILVLTDLVAGALAWAIAGSVVLTGPTGSVLSIVALALLLTPAAMAALGLYRDDVCAARLVEGRRTALAGALTVALIVLLGTSGIGDVLAAEVTAAGAGAVAFLLAGRSGYRSWLHGQRATGRYQRPIVLVGRGTEVAGLLTFYAEHPEVGYEVHGVLADDPTDLPPSTHWLGAFEDDAAWDRVTTTGAAVLAMGGLLSTESHALLRRLRSLGVSVHLHTGLTQISLRRVRALPLAHEPLHYVTDAPWPAVHVAAKRALDLVGASIALVLSAPVVGLAMALVRLEDGGPAIFRQRRVGKHGEPFTMLKLRTMDPDAEARRKEIIDLNERTGPLFKVESDPRVTRVGRWLRELSIDELPQLVNVLRGEMSLVGPRPALPAETALFDDELRRRHEVRPGMTGLWQVEARDKPSIYTYRRLDLFYVDNWTVAGDLSILARTAASIVTRGLRRVLRTGRP